MTFKDLDLLQDILRAIEESGFETPTPIQKAAIPAILQKKDLCACAPTGTGKTAAFILPVLNKIASEPKTGKGPRALILVPTRELALQVSLEAEKYSRYLQKVKTVCIYGGIPYPVQKRNLSMPYEILVATPGRLIDHIERGRIKLSRVEILILDEADRMLDMGFIEPVEQIADLTPKERQTLMFSATLKESVIRLAKDLLNSPERITVASKENHENISQKIYKVDGLDHKLRLLEHLLKDPSIQNALIFTSTKAYADTLHNLLLDAGHMAAVLHGDIPQKKRNYTIAQFKKNKIQILVATDVAARGIDVPSISHVINFDLPNNVTDYIHRIGRTGRAGASGVALSLLSYKDLPIIKELEKISKQKIVFSTVEGLEPRFKEERGPKKFTPNRFKKDFSRGKNFKSRSQNNTDPYKTGSYKKNTFKQEDEQNRSFQEFPKKKYHEKRENSNFVEKNADNFSKQKFKPKNFDAQNRSFKEFPKKKYHEKGENSNFVEKNADGFSKQKFKPKNFKDKNRSFFGNKRKKFHSSRDFS